MIARAGFHGLLSVAAQPQMAGGLACLYRDEDIPIPQQIADQVSGFVESLHVERMRAPSRYEAIEQKRQRVAGDRTCIIASFLSRRPGAH